MQSFLGVDVSKAKLDVALLLPTGKYRSKVFAHDLQGFNSLVQWRQANAPGGVAEVHVCMQATGSYHEALACFLHDQDAAVSVVNPLRVKHVAEVNRQRNKTDGANAKCLAMFCLTQNPARWEAPSPGVRALQALAARLDALQVMRQAECNRLAVAHASVVASVGAVLANLAQAIGLVKAQIARTIHEDPALKTRANLLHTVPGLGDKTVPQLLACVGRPERFKSVKAGIAFASLTPMIRQSGTSRDKPRGTHPMGHQELKWMLYVPAMVAGRYNPWVAAFWACLKAQNKPGQVIVVACMHELLATAYGVLRSGKPFDVNHSKPNQA